MLKLNLGTLSLAMLSVLSVSYLPSNAAEAVDPVLDSVTHKDRLKSDLWRDESRMPRQVLDFFDIKAGMRPASVPA